MSKECMWKCEECSAIFEEDVRRSKDWGHICKAKNFYKEHRCESYLDKYTRQKRKLDEKELMREIQVVLMRELSVYTIEDMKNDDAFLASEKLAKAIVNAQETLYERSEG